MIRFRGFKVLAASAALAVTISLAAPGFSAFAATGKVTAADVNVRSDATTTSSVVGTANSGDTLELGESKDDADGATWYQVTLPSGSTGYIRSDFLEISEDEEGGEDASNADSASTASTEEGAATATSGNTDTTSTANGDYQIVLAPDDKGEDTYYLYDNVAGNRMKLSDIESLKNSVEKTQAAAKEEASKYKVILIVLAILLIIAIAVAVMLFARLRDALSSGRNHERDLTEERRNQRRSGDSSVDGLNSLRRPAGRQSAQGRRNDAYASGSRRVTDATNPAGARNPRTMQTRRPEGAPGTRPQPGMRESQGAQPRRPEAGAAPVRRPAGPAAGSANPAQPQGTRPAPKPQADAPKPQTRRPQPKNFAEDDDLDYDFISLDDNKK
ncbi:SH3 domain-containing protein [Lachnospiraceae bacterium NK3A20]|nr:SH3 domain-containing protein [Lachnospiraceae bacterium NK3A20]